MGVTSLNKKGHLKVIKESNAKRKVSMFTLYQCSLSLSASSGPTSSSQGMLFLQQDENGIAANEKLPQLKANTIFMLYVSVDMPGSYQIILWDEAWFS